MEIIPIYTGEYTASLPIAIVASGANKHDVKLLGAALDNIVIYCPRPTSEKPQHLCLDAGYIGHDDEIIDRMYIPRIRPRGEEKLLIERNPDYKPRRWSLKLLILGSTDSESYSLSSRKRMPTTSLCFVLPFLSLFAAKLFRFIYHNIIVG